jgi:hypothetical protein
MMEFLVFGTEKAQGLIDQGMFLDIQPLQALQKMVVLLLLWETIIQEKVLQFFSSQSMHLKMQ